MNKRMWYYAGDEATDYAQIDDSCAATAYQFDRYCHQYGVLGESKATPVDKDTVTPKYADWRLADGTCNYDDQLSERQCLGQQCMFEYCLWRRDTWVADCEASVAAGDGVPQRPGWGDVYNYGKMHNDLLAGDFANDTCEDYYVVDTYN